MNKAFKHSGLTFMVTLAVMASGLTSAGTAARAFGGDYLSEFITLPLVAVAIGFIVTQTEAAVFLRAGILLAVGVVLWGINRAVIGRSAT